MSEDTKKIVDPHGRISKCVYFPDRAVIDALTERLASMPRATISGVVVQLVTQLANALEAAPKDTRKVTFEATVWV